MYQTSSPQWSEWTQWFLHQDYQQYYRQRQDENGNVDTQWQSELESAPDNHTPRASTVDNLAETLYNTGLQDNEPNPGEETIGEEYQVTGGSTSKGKSRSSNKPHRSSKSKSKSKSSRKGKDRAEEDGEDETERGSEAGSAYRRGSNATHQGSRTDTDPTTGQWYPYPQSSRQDPATGHYIAEGEPAEEDEAAFQTAIEQSRGYNQGQYYAGESSQPAYGSFPVTVHPCMSQDIDATNTGTMEPEEDEGPPTPRNNDYISGTGGETEQLDPRYRIAHSNTFQPGEALLWPEPAGGGGGAPTVSERKVYQDQYGGEIYVNFRRFIVVANDLGHCTCVPIFTYGKKGCKKNGVKAEKHGIVCEVKQRPSLLSGEPDLGFSPIRVEIYEHGERISKESRVNYSKLITVEHNVKVLFVGRVAPNDWETVYDAVNACWHNKIRHRKKHR
ncbi:hypothetical protein FZEAL_2292 [Fusarium zealandicum]|uniref:DUF6590 domain-containing protein n=1 Tax=Fusarium zealandicum TaxID=1053134 RepID=A0A8H4URS5_9HYPO|nr:hypothetical protein FZEAL_2292 [Fusarium zealandicum]